MLKALALDNSLVEVHISLANIMFCSEWDWSGAEMEFQRAVQLNPNSADAHLFYSDYLMCTGHPEEAMAEMNRALELDPLNFFFQCFLGWYLVYLRLYDEAVTQLRKTLKMEPNFSSAYLGLWGAFYQKRMYEEALEEAKRFFTILNDTEVAEALTRGYADGGYNEAMRQAAEKLAERTTVTHVPAVRIARLYAHAGEKDQALKWLDKAYDQRESPLIHLQVAWDWDSLRDDPRFQNLIRRMNFPE